MKRGKKVLTICATRKRRRELCSLIPGCTAQEVLSRALELGIEILIAKNKAALN